MDSLYKGAKKEEETYVRKDLNMNKDKYNPRELRNKISSAKNAMMTTDSFAKVEYFIFFLVSIKIGPKPKSWCNNILSFTIK